MDAEVLVRIQFADANGIQPALAILPPQMNSPQAQLMLITIGLQESRFVYREQIGGPARGFWQFEQGTRASRGGVWGVFLHPASKFWLAHLCQARGVAFEPTAIYRAVAHDDVLAAGVARLLLFTDPKRLPTLDDAEGAWNLYALRTWRPGKPHRHTWDEFHRVAREYVTRQLSWPSAA